MEESRGPSLLGAWNMHKGLMWHKEANLTSRFSSKPRLITREQIPCKTPKFTLNWSSIEEDPPPPVVPLHGGTEAHCGGSAHTVYTNRHALLTFQQVCFILRFSFLFFGKDGVWWRMEDLGGLGGGRINPSACSMSSGLRHSKSYKAFPSF